MTQFEQMLIEKGYIRHFLHGKPMKFVAGTNLISSLGCMDHRYFHSTDTNALQKIAEGKSIMDNDFTWADRKGEICFGLREKGKSPTLISPRPQIEIKRIVDGKEVIEDERYDDSMNVVLKDIPHEDILKAMFDKSIVLKVDLTV